jgi:hypothetical protein
MKQSAQDTLRSVALTGACAGFVLVPSLGPLLGKGEQTRRYDTVITPPDYAFAVWGPIFAGSVASTIGQCLAGGREQSASRRAGWPLAGAYALNTAWSLAAQSDRFALTPALLPAAAALAATAHVRLQGGPAPTGLAATTPVSTGLLLGWTALAGAVNLAAGAVLAGAGKRSSRTVAACTLGLLAVSGGVANGVVRSRRGSLPLAAAAGWGLATTAATPGKPLAVRLAAVAGAAGVLAAALGRATRQRAG